MTRLSADQTPKETTVKEEEAASLKSLKLSNRGLTEVAGLSGFKNLEKLDLSCNNLTTLQGLSSCVNLKWLSVVENRLQNLSGIAALLKLTVLNAGRNIINSIDEVRSLTNLRALILNDNDISSVGQLDKLSSLNALVLSRNPISDIHNSLRKVKSLTKLSISECQLELIGSSLISCLGLKELRLAHNNIKVLPAELSHNKQLQILDLGNNLIRKWSSLKVLSSLRKLKNLNLKGNPIAEKDNLNEKVRGMLPNLQVFNYQTNGERKGTNPPKQTGSSSESPDAEVKSVDNKLKRKKSKEKETKHDDIDDKNKPFIDHILSRTIDTQENNHLQSGNADSRQPDNCLAGIPAKKRKHSKNVREPSPLDVLQMVEVGSGGPSTWGD